MTGGRFPLLSSVRRSSFGYMARTIEFVGGHTESSYTFIYKMLS